MQTKAPRQRQGLGRTGERLAAETLRSRGYRILERNFRCHHGEIDLIAEDAQDLVFVEVKTRRGVSYGRPEEAITPSKRRRLVELASHYLDLHTNPDRSWRIDVVAVQFSKNGRLEEILKREAGHGRFFRIRKEYGKRRSQPHKLGSAETTTCA